jgi:hypothetical protein
VETTYPLPIIPLNANGWLACIATAGRSHVGDRGAPHPRPPIEPQHRRWAARGDRACLFCGVPEPTGGEEHVLSSALGNWFWVLPSNVVCAGCNHGVLSRLDSALQAHPFISMMRVLNNIPGRSGQPPEMRASNVRMSRDTDGRLRIDTNNERHILKVGNELKIQPRWVNQTPRHHRDTARALLKFGLGLLWLAHGPDETSKAKYDHARAAVRGDDKVPIQHGFGNSKLPAHALQGMVVTHEFADGLRVDLDYFGVRLWAETEGSADQASDEFVAGSQVPHVSG